MRAAMSWFVRGRISPKTPTRSPERTKSSAKASPSTMARSAFVTELSFERNHMEGERSIQSQKV